MDRRRFLRGALGAGAAVATGAAGAACGGATLLSGCAGKAPKRAKRGLPPPEKRKLVIVQFGGGTRSSEAVDDPERRWIPRLRNDMIPRGTLFTNMRVEGKVVHPNSTGSIMTGHWEYDDIDWSKPVAHPTVFEVCRRERALADTSAWAFVYASILAKSAESTAPGYGAAFAANVVEPPTIPRSTAEKMDRLMQHAATLGSAGAEIDAAAESAALARSTSRIARGGLRSGEARAFIDREYASWKSGAGSTSHDAFLTDRAVACMKEFAPDVLAVCYGEIDCAHYGSWSRYVDAIRRTDELTWRLFRASEELDDYRGRTLLLVLPDHGRELEREGGWGFVHHSDFYTDTGADEGCRRVWMLAVGPGVAEGREVAEAVPITAASSTGLEYMGHAPSPGSARSVLSLMT